MPTLSLYNHDTLPPPIARTFLLPTSMEPFPFPAAALMLLLLSSTSAIAQSSTVGVGYISRLLEIQDSERAPAAVHVAAAKGVLRWLLPSHSPSFELKLVSKLLSSNL